MPIPEDLAAIAHQERELTLPAFDNSVAWQLGLRLYQIAIDRGYGIVIDIRRFGQPYQPLFYTALPGTTPDNPRWVQRKANVVARFHRSSYAIGLELERRGLTFPERYALPDADYAPHGGCFPINVAGAGILGCITVSGLVQRADHELVVEALCLHTNRSYASLRLPEAD